MSDEEARIARLREWLRRVELAEFERVTAGTQTAAWDGPDPLGGCAPPGQCHPAYAGKAWIREWVNGSGPYADRNDVLIPVFPTAVWESAQDVVEAIEVPLPLRMTRRRARGRAPYVGCPFVYMWQVGVDSLGRQVAGDSSIKYLPFEPHDCDGGCWA